MFCDNRRWMQHCTSVMVYIVQTQNSYSAECRCISGVPLTAAVCRSSQTGGVPLQPAVCRSHHRCGIQRCAAPTSGVPPPRSLAQAVQIFLNPLQKTLNRICFRFPLALFILFKDGAFWYTGIPCGSSYGYGYGPCQWGACSCQISAE